MANIETKLEVKVSDIDMIRDLIEVMVEDAECLPERTAQALRIAAEGGCCEIGIDELMNMGFCRADVGGDVSGLPVHSANQVLKRVKVRDSGVMKYIYPEHYKMQCGETVIMEW